ncbi:PKD-like family protein [Pedobacter caeni]|uniref:PKD-like family protein n=2 Tax=Pedobacter caeni TaxID=288992 RepID=A0A1M5DKY1_9SPHI|nr:PKD-like family protein [Pedobacter caeni]
MIKNKISIVFWLMVTAIMISSSCRKDLGNYEYKEINEVGITDIKESYEAISGQKIEIRPTLQFTKDSGNDTSKYSYEWFAVDDSSAPVVKKPIAKTHDLNWVVNLPSIPKRYLGYYVVTEKSTGITWRTTFSLKVNTNIADGWLILNEVNNEARLDFYNYLSSSQNFLYYNDILSSQTTIKLSGKPKLLYFYNRRDPFSNVSGRAIFVGTDKDTYIINTQNNTFSSYVSMLSIINGYAPPPYYAQKVRSQATWLAYLLDSKGQLFFENSTQATAFGNRVNRLSNGQLINISPYFAEYYGGTLSSYALMYDVDNKRFIEHKDINTSSSVPATSSTLLDPGNVGMDLMYMDSTPALSGQTYAVFKDSKGKVFLARIVCNNTAFDPVAFDEVSTAPEMANATQFAIDPVEGYVMYLAGSKIYRYNPFDRSNTMVVDLGSRKVSLIKYHKMLYNRSNVRYAEYAKKLIICSYDEANPATSGKMELYNVPNLNGALTLFGSFDGLGKIVEVSYRE